MFKKSIFALLALFASMLACSLPVEEESQEVVEEGDFFDESLEMETQAKGGSCPFTGSCPAPVYPQIFMYWTGGSDYVVCRYRLTTYPFTITSLTQPHTGCSCPVGPVYSMGYTCT